MSWLQSNFPLKYLHSCEILESGFLKPKQLFLYSSCLFVLAIKSEEEEAEVEEKTAAQVAELLRWHCKATKVHRTQAPLGRKAGEWNENGNSTQLQSLLIMRVRGPLPCRASKSHYFRRVGRSYLHLYNRLYMGNAQTVRQTIERRDKRGVLPKGTVSTTVAVVVVAIIVVFFFCHCVGCWVHRFCAILL